jgi:hypothetical protein
MRARCPPDARCFQQFGLSTPLGRIDRSRRYPQRKAILALAQVDELESDAATARAYEARISPQMLVIDPKGHRRLQRRDR